MQYALLIYSNEQDRAGLSEQEQKAAFAAWGEYTTWLGDKGWMTAGEALEPVAQATSVRAPGGAQTVTDGPFAETKEQLGGFYLLDVANLDQAIEAAARCPAAAYGTIELRPIMDATAMPDMA